MSTTSRILVSFLLFLAAGIYLFVTQLTRRVERQYFEAAEEQMVDMAQFFAAMVEQQAADDGTLDLTPMRNAWVATAKRTFSARIYNILKTRVNTNLYITDRNGIVLFDSDGGRTEGQNYSHRRDVALSLAGQYGARSTDANTGDGKNTVMFVAAPIRRNGQIIGVASVSKPERSMLPYRDATVAWIRSLGWIFLLSVTAGSYLVVTHFSRPIRRLTQYAHAVARGKRVAPPPGGSPEAVTLGRAFAEMCDALDGRKYVETYVQTLTHEMKSPVAAIRGASELLREEMSAERREKFLCNIDAESHRIQNIIDRLLGLSAIESRKAIEHPKPIPITELAASVRTQLLPAAEARGVTVELSTGAKAIVSGESFLLEIAIANLLQNAIDFSAAGDCIRISIGCSGPWVELRIEDEGSGIPSYALPRIFDRFYSLSHPDTGRKSSGLGLCFVREAAELHDGSVTINNRTDRHGACAVLRLRSHNAIIRE